MVASRKHFLWTGAALTLTGCQAIPSYLRLGAWKPKPETGPFQTPTSDSVDLIKHALSRRALAISSATIGGMSTSLEEVETEYSTGMAGNPDETDTDDTYLIAVGRTG